MSPLNPYFLQGSASEQRLIQDLINEQLKMYGQDVVYLPRKIYNKKTVLREITASKFDDAFRLEAYLINYEGFGGGGDILSKFGVKTTDEVTFVISKEKYEDFISPFLSNDSNIELSSRPQEGDLIYFPLDNTIFEIKYVEGKKPFYQLNNLYIYELRCEVMDFEADDSIETSIDEVDKSVQDFGYIQTIQMTLADTETATAVVQLASNLSAVGGNNIGKSVERIDLINDGTGYLSPPIVSISTAPTEGINATAVAIMTHRSGQTGSSIDKILIINPGIGYTIPPIVTIKSNSGTGGIATAIIESGSLSPFTIIDEGLKYSSAPVVSISAASVGVTSASAQAFINSSGIVTSICYINAGIGYTQAPTITLSSPIGVSTGNYVFNEVVRGVSTGTTAHVNNWDYDTRILQVKVVSGSFAVGETIVGIGTSFGGSNASYKIHSINKQDELNDNADNISIESEADIILDFSQDNPFGDY
jgi:hypothetical protein